MPTNSENNDKRELLKLKQGLLDEKDSEIVNAEKTKIVKPTGKAAVENFFYHHKLHLAFAAFFLSVAAVFLYFHLTTEKVDMTILLIANNAETSLFFRLQGHSLETALEEMIPDYDKSGYINADCLFIDLVKEGKTMDSIEGNSIKLFGEVSGGEAALYIGNKEALEYIPATAEVSPEDFYYTLIPAKKYFSPQSFGEIPDDICIAVRKSANKSADYDKAMALFETITIE